MENNVQVVKKVVSATEFEKRVQIEAQNLIYFDRLKEDEAWVEAKKYVSSKFEIGKV